MSDGPKSLYDADFFIAWERFAEEVSLAFEAAASEAEGRPLATEQTRYVLANMAIAKLLRTIGQNDLAKKFHYLAEALHDVVEGVKHPLFKVEAPSGKAGRQRDTSAAWRIRANLCVGIEFLKAGGMDEAEAIKQVIKKYKKSISRLLRPNTTLDSSLRSWIKSFASDEVLNDVALSTYKDGMESLQALKPRFTDERVCAAGMHLIGKAAGDAATSTGI
jgi:hypothetical protein